MIITHKKKEHKTMQVNFTTYRNTPQRANIKTSRHPAFTSQANLAESLPELLNAPGAKVIKAIAEKLRSPEMIECRNKLNLIIKGDNETPANDIVNALKHIDEQNEKIVDLLWYRRPNNADIFNKEMSNEEIAQILPLEKAEMQEPENFLSLFEIYNPTNQRAFEYITREKINNPIVKLMKNLQDTPQYQTIERGFKMLEKMVKELEDK